MIPMTLQDMIDAIRKRFEIVRVRKFGVVDLKVHLDQSGEFGNDVITVIRYVIVFLPAMVCLVYSSEVTAVDVFQKEVCWLLGRGPRL